MRFTARKLASRVEHLFGILKGQFGYKKVRYRGLDKNAHAVFTKCALANLVMANRHYHLS
ncbi:MAG: transposase [Hahellaceae bacterium]|nr:transposase [Hahellaceae bacterium]